MRVAALVAAAGTSVRMGFPKALLALPDDSLLLVRHVHTLTACQVDPVLVTLPPGDVFPARSDVENHLTQAGAQVRDNRFMDRGLLGSVQTVVATLQADGLLLLPVDTPGITVPLVDAVLRGARMHQDRFVRPRVGTETGHPLWIPRHAFGRILAFNGDGGVRALLTDVVDVPWLEPLACVDVDTPEDAAVHGLHRCLSSEK